MCFFDLFEEEQPKNKRVPIDPLFKKAIIDDLIKKQKSRCMYCGDKVRKDLFDLDHKNPVAPWGYQQEEQLSIALPHLQYAQGCADR